MYPAKSLPDISENITPNNPRYTELIQIDKNHHPKFILFMADIRYSENIIKLNVIIIPIMNLVKNILMYDILQV